MHHYYLSFYGQTTALVRECMREVQKIEPLMRGWMILEEPIECGPNKASHTVDLWFTSKDDCVQATTIRQILAQTYLPYAVGAGFIAQRPHEPLDLTPDLVAYPRHRRPVPQHFVPAKPRVREQLHIVS